MIGCGEPHAPHDDGIGPGLGVQHGSGVIATLAHPRRRPRVVEPHAQGRLEGDLALDPDVAAHEVGAVHVGVSPARQVRRRRDERFVHFGRARRGLPAGDEHERVAVVVALDRGIPILRTQLPPPLLVATEQRPEDARRVVARRAEPVDRAGARNERARAAIAQQGIVLEGRRNIRLRRVHLWQA